MSQWLRGPHAQPTLFPVAECQSRKRPQMPTGPCPFGGNWNNYLFPDLRKDQMLHLSFISEIQPEISHRERRNFGICFWNWRILHSLLSFFYYFTNIERIPTRCQGLGTKRRAQLLNRWHSIRSCHQNNHDVVCPSLCHLLHLQFTPLWPRN